MQTLICIAYIGPGAGFAFVGSFFLLVLALALALLSFLTWPLRAVGALFRRRARRAREDIRRIVVLGLDGFDPEHYRRLARLNRLPNLQRLEREGVFADLYSTCPPISPVAWSTFATGTNPGKHNIFDFLGRDTRTMTLELSSVQIRENCLGYPVVEGRRKSKAFWSVLGEHGVFSHVFRVPLTFPPEPFFGLMLSGLCVPDVRGTQGTFALCTDDGDQASMTGGQRVRVERLRGALHFELPGPKIGDRMRTISCRVTVLDDETAVLYVQGHRRPLRIGVYTPWVRLVFGDGLSRKVSGICRFCLLKTRAPFQLYVSPIHVDPERPPFPISHPRYYSIYLGKLHGPFATLGMAEDTWALNEGVLSEAQFLEQVYDYQRERQCLFLDMLDRTKNGLVIGVFEAPDRVQHMFPPDPSHPFSAPELDEVYRRMDLWVEQVLKKIDLSRDVLMVVSDHGFTTFRRGVNLNAWLAQHGYLIPLPGEPTGYLRDIDWSRTRAYAFGLSGIYLNRKGRERQGIVDPTEAAPLKREIAARLRELRDPKTGERVVHEVYDAEQIYRGPYTVNAPDLMVGFERGYRMSWDGAIGKREVNVLTDNPKHWQGDHCVDYRLVPGVFFCSRKIRAESALHLRDVAPTILQAFGVEPPHYMDGKPFGIEPPSASADKHWRGPGV